MKRRNLDMTLVATLVIFGISQTLYWLWPQESPAQTPHPTTTPLRITPAAQPARITDVERVFVDGIGLVVILNVDGVEYIFAKGFLIKHEKPRAEK